MADPMDEKAMLEEWLKEFQRENYKLERRCFELEEENKALREHINALKTELKVNNIQQRVVKLVADQDQQAKADAGKLRLTLVPPEIIWAIAEVREYGCRKYGDPENWKKVSPQRYRDAAFRHFMAYLAGYDSVDQESGLPRRFYDLVELLAMTEGGGGDGE